jgi:hypothetical protein
MKKPTQKDVEKVLSRARALRRFISKGIVDYAVPDEYEDDLKAIINILQAAKPLFPKR